MNKNRTRYRKYVNRHVEIRTTSGTYRGKLVKVGRKHAYLKLNDNRRNKAGISFFPIIPLVLYNILVIVLLDGPRPKPYPYGPYSPYRPYL